MLPSQAVQGLQLPSPPGRVCFGSRIQVKVSAHTKTCFFSWKVSAVPVVLCQVKIFSGKTQDYQVYIYNMLSNGENLSCSTARAFLFS